MSPTEDYESEHLSHTPYDVMARCKYSLLPMMMGKNYTYPYVFDRLPQQRLSAVPLVVPDSDIGAIRIPQRPLEGSRFPALAVGWLATLCRRPRVRRWKLVSCMALAGACAREFTQKGHKVRQTKCSPCSTVGCALVAIRVACAA